MKAKDLRYAQELVTRLRRGEAVIRVLNEINGGENNISFPSPEVWEFVDRQAAAKGLLSLVIEGVAEERKKLEELGIEL